MTLLERFLRYVSIDTQSDPAGETFPSTANQLTLLNLLAEEMSVMGLADVDIDAYGYVTATIPATEGMEGIPTVGFLAHVDTSPDMSGANVNPQIIPNYDGGDIILGSGALAMRVDDFPELAELKGHTLITTDGTTLLGADDKAGIAEIMTAAHYLLSHPGIAHGRIRIGFTPDEETGRGVDFFDVEKFGAKFAYTVDGGPEGELEFENFNAAEAKVTIHGRNIHPGYAKGKMINALHVAKEFDSHLPYGERPEYTDGYQGFYHLTSMSGTPEHAETEYLIRDHSREMFEAKKERMCLAAETLNVQYGDGTIELELKDQYYNMREMIAPYPEIIEKAEKAMTAAGVTPIIKPIRGGTDGARLSYMGIPCPNLFTGGMNFHGRYECCSLQTMEKAVRTIVNLARIWAE